MADRPTGKPANWYPDPERKKKLRYWDGTRWTDHWIAKPPGRRSALPPPPDLTTTPISTLPTAQPHFSFDDEDNLDEYQNPWAKKKKAVKYESFEPFIPMRDLSEDSGDKKKKVKVNKPGKPPKPRSKIVMILVPLIVVAVVVAFAFLVVLPKMAPTPPPVLPPIATAVVPDVEGKTVRVGIGELKEAKFERVLVQNASGARVNKLKGRKICSTTPPAGEIVKAGSRVTVIVRNRANPCPKQ